MIIYEIPLLPNTADQTLDIAIEGVPYTLRVLWNERFQFFTLSIRERGGEDIMTGIKLVPYAPLVGNYRRLPFKGDLYFIHRTGKTYRPGFEDIGGNAYGLFYYDPEVVPVYPLPLEPAGA
jgi:hypothetical protein